MRIPSDYIMEMTIGPHQVSYTRFCHRVSRTVTIMFHDVITSA